MNAIGEVLSASITGLVAECWQKEDLQAVRTTGGKPRFGSYLTIDSSENVLSIFAVVFDVITGPQDNLHKPAALGMTREQLKLEQPQIFALLKTEIHAAIIGYSIDGACCSGLPPHPPQVHDFVRPSSQEEIIGMTTNLDFVRLVARVPSVPSDELIAACIKEACAARGGDYDFLVEAGQSLAHTFRDDYDRLSSVLRKIRP